MARPRKNDGRLFRKEESKFWWMDYRDREGKRQRESTNTDDWDEAQRRLRERLQARTAIPCRCSAKGSSSISRNGRSTSWKHFRNHPFERRRRIFLIAGWRSI